MNQSIIYWIWLAETCGPDSDLPLRLIHTLGGAKEVFCADRDTLAGISFLEPKEIDALCDKNTDRMLRIADTCQAHNIGIIAMTDPLYPRRLRRLQSPPAVLYYRGRIPNFDERLSIAVVGTRGMTDTGRRETYRIAYELSLSGAVIVSGLALGVDGVAGKAAMDAGGDSVAVLGCAIDCCYPREHRELYDRMIASGCVMSEYAPGTPTRRYYFPQRNRIIAGLCQGTLVTEAGDKSGALITAQLAANQGRDLFAVPGDTDNPAKTGCNLLIKAGAIAVTDSEDILDRYGDLYRDTLHPKNRSVPAYYGAYDDTLKYGHEKVEAHRAEAHTEPSPHPHLSPYPTSPSGRRIPREKPLRELSHAENVAAILAEATARTAEMEERTPTPPAPFGLESVSDRRTAPDARPTRAQTPAPGQKSSQKGGAAPSPAPAVASKPISPMKEATVPPAAPASLQRTLTVASADPISPQKETTAAVPPAPFRATPKKGLDALSDPLLTDLHKKVLALVKEGKSFDDICAAGIAPGDLMIAFTVLELGGYIRAIPGGAYEYIE